MEKSASSGSFHSNGRQFDSETPSSGSSQLQWLMFAPTRRGAMLKLFEGFNFFRTDKHFQMTAKFSDEPNVRYVVFEWEYCTESGWEKYVPALNQNSKPFVIVHKIQVEEKEIALTLQFPLGSMSIKNSKMIKWKLVNGGKMFRVTISFYSSEGQELMMQQVKLPYIIDNKRSKENLKIESIEVDFLNPSKSFHADKIEFDTKPKAAPSDALSFLSSLESESESVTEQFQKNPNLTIPYNLDDTEFGYVEPPTLKRKRLSVQESDYFDKAILNFGPLGCPSTVNLFGQFRDLSLGFDSLSVFFGYETGTILNVTGNCISVLTPAVSIEGTVNIFLRKDLGCIPGDVKFRFVRNFTKEVMNLSQQKSNYNDSTPYEPYGFYEKGFHNSMFLNQPNYWGCSLNSMGQNLLHQYAQRGMVQHVFAALESGICPMSFDNFDRTPLHLAASQGHVYVSQILIKKAGLNSLLYPDRFNENPLQIAVRRGLLQYVSTLCIWLHHTYNEWSELQMGELKPVFDSLREKLQRPSSVMQPGMQQRQSEMQPQSDKIETSYHPNYLHRKDMSPVILKKSQSKSRLSTKDRLLYQTKKNLAKRQSLRMLEQDAQTKFVKRQLIFQQMKNKNLENAFLQLQSKYGEPETKAGKFFKNLFTEPTQLNESLTALLDQDHWSVTGAPVFHKLVSFQRYLNYEIDDLVTLKQFSKSWENEDLIRSILFPSNLVKVRVAINLFEDHKNIPRKMYHLHADTPQFWGTFRTALIVGEVLVEWLEDSLVNFRKLSNSQLASLPMMNMKTYFVTKRKFKAIASKIVEWNCHCEYDIQDRNCMHFVDDLMTIIVNENSTKNKTAWSDCYIGDPLYDFMNAVRMNEENAQPYITIIENSEKDTIQFYSFKDVQDYLEECTVTSAERALLETFAKAFAMAEALDTNAQQGDQSDRDKNFWRSSLKRISPFQVSVQKVLSLN